jgi:NitT/TauT family transport system permease protein
MLGVLPITPEYPGRLSVITREDHTVDHLGNLFDQRIGTVADEFADERYLSQDRNLVLLDLKIANDVNLPHLQNIAEALLQPARRNGPLLLTRILSNAALHTWGEALLGFTLGATLGFFLGTIFAHFAPLERGLLPYVVASQTVPILAIAPMVVIWLGAGPVAVAVISAYITFFPVTINTLRGLRSPDPNALELMQSYAASKWEIMWKLRFPAALPYIFTALKVSATASVVGAIIGELPSSIRDGLGRAILDFSSDYSLISTPKLWAAIFMAASVGIVSFLIVGLVERIVLRGYIRST